MTEDGYELLLTGSRWLLLKRPENLSEKQAVKLSELLQYNLKSVRSHLMKEDFQLFWTYTHPAWAGVLNRFGAVSSRSPLICLSLPHFPNASI